MSRLDVRSMALLASAHLADDINQSFIPALLPYLIAQRGMSHAEAGLLVLAQGLSSSVIQPAIGHLADRRSMPWLIAAGLLLAGGGVAFLGIASSLPLLFLAALTSGVGVAIFHPEAARFANYVAGEKKATGMRWFTAGGNVGFAVGPAFATAAIALWGLHGSLVAVVPVAIIAGVVLLELRRLLTFVPAHATRRSGAGRDDWPAFLRLSAFVIVRSMAYFGFVAFTPLYVVETMHVAPAVGDGTLSAFLVAGVLGTLAGGPIADRLGRKTVMTWSTGIAALLTGTLVALHAPLAATVVLLAVIGFIFYASQASMIVLGQEFLPNHVGLASGVTLGLAVSLGGMFSPVLGALADRDGIAATMLAVGVLAALAFGIGLGLPSERARRAAARGKAVA